jgi:hypothetical protein
LNAGDATDKAPDDKDRSSETSSAAEVLPNATSDSPPLNDARFQRATATDVADRVAIAALIANGNINHSAAVADPTAAILSIRLSEEISNDSKIVYLESLGKLPFEEMWRFTPRHLLEQAIAAAYDDYRANGTASALARRLRRFFGKDE